MVPRNFGPGAQRPVSGKVVASQVIAIPLALMLRATTTLIKVAPATLARDESLGKRLWEVSRALAGLPASTPAAFL